VPLLDQAGHERTAQPLVVSASGISWILWRATGGLRRAD